MKFIIKSRKVVVFIVLIFYPILNCPLSIQITGEKMAKSSFVIEIIAECE